MEGLRLLKHGADLSLEHGGKKIEIVAQANARARRQHPKRARVAAPRTRSDRAALRAAATNDVAALDASAARAVDDRDGATALHAAAARGALEAVQALLVAGADPARRAKDGANAALAAARWRDAAVARADAEGARAAAIVEAMLFRGAQPPGVARRGSVAPLDDAEALLLARDGEGESALHLMVSSAAAALLGRLARHRPARRREGSLRPRGLCDRHAAATHGGAIFFLGRYKIFKGAFEHQSATSVVVRALDLYASELYGRVFDASNADGSSGPTRPSSSTRCGGSASRRTATRRARSTRGGAARRTPSSRATPSSSFASSAAARRSPSCSSS